MEWSASPNKMGSSGLIALLLALSATVVAARRSPNAAFIDEMMQKPEFAPNSRFSSDVFEDARLDVPDLIRKYNYPCEVHTVVTEDGYILEMHRIPWGRDQNNQPDFKKIPIFMMHGLLSSSADYVIKGPGNALAYRLAEEGYDVWMGNARGTYYSRNHTSLNPDDKVNQDFWRFSWDEIGGRDIPAFVDHILATTRQPKLHYLGFSQGGTTFLTFASLRPEYNEKLISFQGLAPASFFVHNNFRPFEIAAPHADIIEFLFFQFGFGEILGRSNLIRWIGSNVCADGAALQPLCLNFPILGEWLQAVNTTMLPAFLGHAPAGASIRQLGHYAQGINDGTFRRYNHGVIGNLAAYGQLAPPHYNLGLITAPAYLHYAQVDVFVHPEDVYLLAQALANVKMVRRTGREDFGHLDYIWGRDVSQLVNDEVVASLRLADADAALGL